MLTTRGWALAAGNLTLLIAGRLLGVRELFELGLGLATLVIAACVVVRRGGHDTRLATTPALPGRSTPSRSTRDRSCGWR